MENISHLENAHTKIYNLWPSDYTLNYTVYPCICLRKDMTVL